MPQSYIIGSAIVVCWGIKGKPLVLRTNWDENWKCFLPTTSGSIMRSFWVMSYLSMPNFYLSLMQTGRKRLGRVNCKGWENLDLGPRIQFPAGTGCSHCCNTGSSADTSREIAFLPCQPGRTSWNPIPQWYRWSNYWNDSVAVAVTVWDCSLSKIFCPMPEVQAA